MNKRTVGSLWEKRAAEYLEAQGMQILTRNYRIRSGEIDLIAKDGAYLVFVEVKYRADTQKGTPLEAVGKQKQRAVIQTARHFLLRHGFDEDTPVRFDVIGITGERLEHIKNAFWC